MVEENAASSSVDKPLADARPLFVGGCARSGTTAFANYLNQHEEILLCQERYKGRAPRVSWNFFSFDRIMDFEWEVPKRLPLGQDLSTFIDYHARLLDSKDPSKLKWLGDKGPFYVRYMGALAGQNPGARFIMLYRPLEEVAESWEARAKNPEDPWLSERNYEMSVEIWNQAMVGMRDFAETSPLPRLLVVSYQDFFYQNESVMPQISRFLGVEFDKDIATRWSETSKEFESSRRKKKELSPEQTSYLHEHADRDAEAWVLERIRKQWEDPNLYIVEDENTTTSALDNMEARVWRLHRKVGELERDLARARRKKQQSNKKLKDLQNTKSWKLLQRLSRVRDGMFSR